MCLCPRYRRVLKVCNSHSPLFHAFQISFFPRKRRRENEGINAFQSAAARLRPCGLAGQGWCQSCREASQPRLKRTCPTQNAQNSDQANRPELRQTIGTDDGCSYDCFKTDVSGSRQFEMLFPQLPRSWAYRCRST